MFIITKQDIQLNIFNTVGMLPMAVADDLKHGKPAPAKLFPCATIYFRLADSKGIVELICSTF